MSPPPISATLLCIDDQELGLRVRKLFLESFGYTVLTARSGAEGLKLLEDNPVDAIVLDYRMQDMDGAEVATVAHHKRPGLPIILLSGYISEFPQDLRGQVSAFVAKGSAPHDLLHALDRILGGKPSVEVEEQNLVVEETRDLVDRVSNHLAKATDHVGEAKRIVSSNVERLEEFKKRHG